MRWLIPVARARTVVQRVASSMPAMAALHEEPCIESGSGSGQEEQPRPPSPEVRAMLGYQVERTNRQKDGEDHVGAHAKQSAPSIVGSAMVHCELPELESGLHRHVDDPLQSDQS
jgi:hypothetical protein